MRILYVMVFIISIHSLLQASTSKQAKVQEKPLTILNKKYMLAAAEGKAQDVLDFLTQGADIHCVDAETGDSALIIAARKQHAAVVKVILLKQYNDISHKNNKEETALAAATTGKKCNAEIVKYLLEHGANPVDAVNYKDIVKAHTPQVPRI